jgi:N-acylneuraminate cytidylyltransferase
LYDGKKILGVIPARGGSKGIPRKNLVKIGGKPLIAYTIEAGQSSAYIDRLILSSEDPEIIETAKRLNCEVPFVRPPHLSDDRTSNLATVLHAIDAVPGYDFVVLLQPTSPLRAGADIDACIQLCIDKDAPSCVSMTESTKSPQWMYYLESSGKLRPVIDRVVTGQRQDLEKAYVLNGAVYVAGTDWLRKSASFVGEGTEAYVMPAERSIDIDSEFDLVLMEACLSRTAGRA